MILDHGPVWIGATLCLAALPAMALTWDLPEGRFERKAAPGELKQVQILPDKGLRLLFASGQSHALAVLSASYRMTAQKFSDYHVTAEVRSLSLGKRSVKRIERMGLTIGQGQKLRFSLSFACVSGHEQIQFCLHDEVGGKPHVICHDLVDPESTCQPPPPRPPGHLINPPPNAGVVNQDTCHED